jgi:FAD dependent oxidoreductase TIGR03364
MAFDLAVVGAGIVGLAHAWVAARAGLRVVVLDRDHRPNGASVRNFGFVTVTGQGAGDTWRRARRSRDVWAEVAPLAGIEVLHRGLSVVAHTPEALDVAAEFAAGPMGGGCEVLGRAEALRRFPYLASRAIEGALASPHELRVESRTAVPRLAAWLAERHGVEFRFGAAAVEVGPGLVRTPLGAVRAGAVAVCPGHDYRTLLPGVFAGRGLRECKLHMLRLSDPGWRLGAAVMSDLGLLRYRGYADCPSLPRLAARWRAEAPELIADGIHLIAVQGADGSLVVGDSHHYAPTVDDFAPEEVDARILALAARALDLSRSRVSERWIGVYGSGPDDAVVERVEPGLGVAAVTSGTGASTAFGLAEDSLRGLLGLDLPAGAAA